MSKPHTSHSHVNAHSASRIFPCAWTYISRQPPFCFTTSKNLISIYSSCLGILRRHSRIFGDVPEAWQWQNWQASDTPNKLRRLSVFRRSRLGVIKYLLTFVPASCFICQTVERHGTAASAISKACRGKPRCKSCFSKLSMRGVSHKS